ncbi:S-layer homology domain-containing protein [Paenibacillus oryzisoli]|uniref:S-layer homology domain-containing protein n=1 Tax=Paenibacillus oryzisoli TaxID=1850517 RepID=UPI003D299F28
MLKRKVSSLFLILFLFFNISTSAYAENVSQIIGDNNTVVFVDLTPNYDWAKEAIKSFAQQGIVSGVGDGKFAPDEMVTREQFAKMLVLTFNAALTSPQEPTFSDVPLDKWSNPYIEVSKDFLTGYVNPFGGKMSFHPEEAATREDIAVSLIRIMGLSDQDVSNPNYAKYAFNDAYNISPGLLKYVSIAAERGLINGYEDGTFRPTQGITRAESVVLLNRATKQAVSSATEELDVSASIITGQNPNEVTLSVKAEEGTKITVDGEALRMDKMGNGYIGGMVLYSFEEEGTKTFKIEATKGAKRKMLEKTAKYQILAPVLTITQAPTNSEINSATIKGTVSDKNDSNPIVTINGKDVGAYYGSFEKTVSLVEGDNTFTIVATNKLGKSTTVEKTISFGAGAPILNITQAPINSEINSATIRGTVSDTNDSNPIVTINGKDVGAYYGSFEKTVSLAEGDNKFTIVATNKLGKSTTVEKTISFGAGSPVLNITQAPTSSEINSATIRGTVSDKNDSNPIVTINGKDVGAYYGSFEKTVSLTEGDNKFTIVATNKLGKSTTVEKTISFGAGAPVLNITQAPVSSEVNSVTIRGNVSDKNDSNPIVTINGKDVGAYYGSFEKTVSLAEGDNKFTIVATNKLGKSTTVEKTITFIISAPQITFTNMPEVTNQKTLSLQGNIRDNDSNLKLYINDQEVSLDYSKNFSKSVTLSEGDNTFVFRAVNSYGKSTSIVKTTKFTEPVPSKP